MTWLRQRDSVTCGPSVAVMAGALLDSEYGAPLTSGEAQRWFHSEQGRVHRAVNVVWPRALGTTPAGMARALSVHGARYRWRPARGDLADVRAAVSADWPVAMLVGSLIPRHWVLLTAFDATGPHGEEFRCYEPSSGRVVGVAVAAIRTAALSNVGFPRPFAFVLPTARELNRGR